MRRRVSALVCFAGGLATAGCAAKVPPRLDHDALRASHPRTLMLADRRSPPITVEGPAKEGPDVRRLFGLVGAVVIAGSDRRANKRRARWMKGCSSEDPVAQMRETVGDDLAKALSLDLMEADRPTTS